MTIYINRIQNWIIRITAWKNNNPMIIKMAKFIAICLLCVVAFNSATYRYKVYQGKSNMVEAEKARNELKQINDQLKKDADASEKLKRQQVIAVTTKKFTVVLNALEVSTSMAASYVNLLTDWAKEKGYDGIVFGRIQPSHQSNKMLFATYDGDNGVPLDYVIEKLKDASATNVVSFMSNRESFWLPAPFTQQVDGILQYKKVNAVRIIGIKLSNNKFKIRSKNFNGVIEDSYIDGQFDEL